MTNFKKTIFILLLFIPLFAYGQSPTWQKLYNGPNSSVDIGYDVCQTTDGNFIAVGGTTITDIFDALYALKLNPYGDTIWSKVIYIQGSRIAAFAVTSTSDGGCVLTGQYIFAFTIKLDKDGNINWQKEYGSSTYPQFYDIINTPDEGFIACGRIAGAGGYILKIDSLGNFQWDKILPGEFIDLNSVDNAHNSGYILSGTIYDTPSQDTLQALVIRIDSSGNTLWQKRFSMLEGMNSKCISTLDSGYLLSGSTGTSMGSKIYTLRLDTYGIIINSQTYKLTVLESLRSFCKINDNRYLFANSWDSANITNGRLMITDSSGNILKQKVYQSVKYLYLESAKTTTDGGFIFAGVWGKWGAGDRDDFYVLKTDSNLNAPQIVNISSNDLFVPEDYRLYPAFPNPFNPSTNIKFELKKAGNVRIKIYNIGGKEIAKLVNEKKNEGIYSIVWNASGNRSGIYFCQLYVNEKHIKTVKLILLN